MDAIPDGNESEVFERIPSNTDALLVGLPGAFVEPLVRVVERRDDPPRLRFLGVNGDVSRTLDDFLLESEAAGLIADGTLSLRTTNDPTQETAVVEKDRVTILVTADGMTGALEAAEDPFVTELSRKYERRWETAAPFSLRSPPRASIIEEATEKISEEFAADLDAAFAGADSLRWSDVVDPLVVCLLVGARHGVQMHDLGRWGEHVGIASRSSFSRTKQRLESSDLLDTERVPQGVGRPRQRLIADTEELLTVDAEDFVEYIRQVLA